MPRYYFNVRDGQDIPDRDGTELPDLKAAQQEALRYTCALIAELDGSFWDGEPWTMEVTDAAGLVLFRLDFAGTLAPSARPAESFHQERRAPH